MIKKGILIRLDRKYWKTEDNAESQITYLHCMPLDFNKAYGVMKDN
jgi:hypothetical protein